MSTAQRETLTQLADHFGSDKGDVAGDRHGYTHLYELLLGPLRNQPIRLLEIGLARGGPETAAGRTERKVDSPSVSMWLSFFSKAHVVGFDISDFSHLSNERFTFIRGDAGSSVDLEHLAGAAPAFDVIIDDGSHASFHQQYCLKHLWPKLSAGGLYIIEDLHWQSPVYESSLPLVPTTADFCADLFDRGALRRSAAFTKDELRRLRSEVETHAIFRDQAGRGATPKLLVLRKRSAASVEPLPEMTAAEASADGTRAGDGSAKLPSVRSFDLFDTLVARRCIWPGAIFELVGQRLGLPGFPESRVAAEACISHQDYSLDDIYDRLHLDRADLAGRLDDAKALELSLELEHLFPIAENVAQVSSGDIVVSDMYLPPAIVERIVRENAGLRDVAVFVTPHGKRRGTIWPVLRNHYEIVEHLGDNVDTDLRSPAAHRIASRRTTSFEPTPAEREIAARGLPRLSEAVRESRLSTWAADPEERSLQVLQTNVNAPMLLVATVLVLRAARQAGVSRLLASGRDCYLWLKLIERLAPVLAPEITASYFYTSRVCRSFPSHDYQSYVSRAVGDHSAFVLDICGTGWSLQRLFERLEIRRAQPLLLQKMTDPSLRARYESWAPTRGTTPVFALLNPSLAFNNELVELANSAPHATVIDVVGENGHDRPVFLDHPAGFRAAKYRTIQEAAFTDAIPRLLASDVIDETLPAPSEALVDLLAFLYGSFGAFAPTLHKLTPEHRIEDERVCALLRTLGESQMARAA